MSTYRTNTCGELTIKDLDKKVTLAGFVLGIRDHGGVMFIDLRDHYGVTQIVVHDDTMLKGVTKETVIKVTGKVVKRDIDTVNKNTNRRNRSSSRRTRIIIRHCKNFTI